MERIKVMNKKQYIFPLTEVANVNMSTAVLTGSGSPEEDWQMPIPNHPGAPKRRTPVF